MKPNLNLPLLAGKVAVFAGAVALDMLGKLSPQAATLSLTMLVSLGAVHVVQMLKSPPVSEDVITNVANLALSVVRELQTPPHVASSPSSRSSSSPATATATAPPQASIASKLGPFAVLLFAGVSLRALAACTPPAATAPTDTEIAAFASEQVACSSTCATKPDIDACRARSRAAWCARWPGAINCTGDAGAGDAGAGG